MDPLNKCTEQNQEISPAPVFDLNSNLLKKGTAVLAVPFLYCRRNSASIPILLKAHLILKVYEFFSQHYLRIIP